MASTRKPSANQRQSPKQNANLADALRNPPGTSGSCTLHRIRMDVDDSTRNLIDERIEDIRKQRTVSPVTSPNGITSSWLARILNEYGFQISPLTVQKHIAKRCRCGY